VSRGQAAALLIVSVAEMAVARFLYEGIVQEVHFIGCGVVALLATYMFRNVKTVNRLPGIQDERRAQREFNIGVSFPSSLRSVGEDLRSCANETASCLAFAPVSS
jgi:hypothetical protein